MIVQEQTAQTKVCRKCGNVLPTAAFYRRSRKSEALFSYCKDCDRRKLRGLQACEKAAPPAYKTCRKCGWNLPAAKFSRLSAARDGLAQWCQECNQRACRARYVALPGRRFLFEYLSTHPCVECGEADPRVLEFDHVRGTKAFTIGLVTAKGKPVAELQVEIEKCDVRCANCHRRQTATQQAWFEDLLPVQ